MLDVKNFQNFTPKEYIDNLKRLSIDNHHDLVGEVVYYSKKTYGEHTVLLWDDVSAEYLVKIDKHEFWTNPFRLLKYDKTKGYTPMEKRNKCISCKYSIKYEIDSMSHFLYCTKNVEHFEVCDNDVCDEFENE